MGQFLFSRLIQSIFVLFILSILIFLIIQIMPGDFQSRFMMENPGKIPTQKELEDYKKKLGMDKALYLQYLDLMANILSGDFGLSEQYQMDVKDLLYNRIKSTLKLTVPVFLLSLFIAIPLGILSAMNQYSRIDYLMNIFIFFAVSIPTFWIGLVFIYFFSLKLGLFPAGGMKTIGVDSILDQSKYYFLPVIVLSSHSIGYWVRYLRGSLLDVLRLDYIRTAKAKGLSREKVLLKHALRNAMIPLITLIALSIPHLVSGALITEEIFGISGMGQLLIQSILQKDRELALTAFLLLAILTFIFNFIADLLYTTIDPRIKRK